MLSNIDNDLSNSAVSRCNKRVFFYKSGPETTRSRGEAAIRLGALHVVHRGFKLSINRIQPVDNGTDNVP